MPLAKIFLLAAGVLLLASTALGYMNMTRLKATQESFQQVTQTAKANADRAEKSARDLKASQGQLEAANKNAADLQGKLASATQEAAAARTAAEDNGAKIAAVTAELESTRATFTKLGGSNNAAPGADPTLELTNKLRELEAQVAEARQIQQSLQAQAKTADDSLREFRRREDLRQRNVMTNGLAGTIRAVDLNWNFVVLDLGDRQGVVNNAEMIITRGGSMVGKVRITSVEPGQSIADIVPNSVPAGVSVQRGDRVIYAGNEPVRR